MKLENEPLCQKRIRRIQEMEAICNRADEAVRAVFSAMEYYQALEASTMISSTFCRFSRLSTHTASTFAEINNEFAYPAGNHIKASRSFEYSGGHFLILLPF